MLFDGNVVAHTNGEGAGLALRTGSGEDRTSGVISRTRFLSHLVGRSQLHVAAGDRTRVDVWDSLVARGYGGVILLATRARVRLTNLTVVDNDSNGIMGSSNEGSISVFNTIAARNGGIDLRLFGPDVLSGFNLEGVDPGFRPTGPIGWTGAPRPSTAGPTPRRPGSVSQTSHGATGSSTAPSTSARTSSSRTDPVRPFTPPPIWRMP